MADTEEVSPATLLDQLASLDPQERREVAAIVRPLSENLAEVPDGKTTSAGSRLRSSIRPRRRQA